jgi:hypothetical protein
MSEFGIRATEALADVVRTSENAKEDAWRERFLAENLFHNAHLDEVLGKTEDKIQLYSLEQEFLEEKRDKTMGERFALAISAKYRGKIHVVELGRTTNPGVNGEVDGLKDEYRDLLKWMQENGVVERELERHESGRNMSIRKPVHEEAANKLVIVVRNRPLVETEIVHEGVNLSIGITKRMVFGLPHQSMRALLAVSPELDLNSERVQQFIEGNFLKDGWGGVQPIRTAYYLATDVR